MSHFSVMVIGRDVDRAMAPYHEFECTGVDNEFVVNVDITKTAREAYEKDTCERLRDAGGALHSFFTAEGNWVPQFSQPDPDRKYDKSARTYFVPDDYERVTVAVKDCESFADWAADYYGMEILCDSALPDLTATHKYGWIRVENDQVTEIIDRTNPNKKWDWYVMGGRWSNYLKAKDGRIGGRYVKTPREIMFGDKSEPPSADYYDQLEAGSIDWEGMRSKDAAEAEANYDKYEAATKGLEMPPTWEETLAAFPGDIPRARDEHNYHPWVVAVHEAFPGWWLSNLNEYWGGGREAFVQRARDRAGITYAYVKDGQWFAKGEMGWFGMSDEKGTQDEWNRHMIAMIDALPPDELVTIVDCHI